MPPPPPPPPSAAANLADDFLSRLGAPGAGLGFGGAAAEEEEAEGSDEEGESEAALSKRAAKKQRKRELSEAEAIAETPISSGFGHAMLLKMGWAGQGAGLREDGIAEPVKAAVPVSKRGLAADDEGEAGGPAAAAAAAPAAAADASGNGTADAAGGISRKAAKRARLQQDKGAAPLSRAWLVELELSAPADEEAVRASLMNASNVLWVPRLEPSS